VDLVVWRGLSLLKANFSPQAGDHPFFHSWHCHFLQLVGQEMLSLLPDKLAISLFEWTVDSGQ